MALNRRQFVQTTLGAAAALGTVRMSRAAAPATSDIRLAVIGFNGRGREHLSWISNQVVALCDVDSRLLASTADQLSKSQNRKIDAYGDYRKLLENPNIDAVTVATPNHTHSLIAIAAIQAGKHVYCEKPVSYNIWEGRQLVAAARQHNRIVQTGTQSRSSKALQDAQKYIQAGELGPIQWSQGLCYKPRVAIGKSATPFHFPEFIDKDLWIGPAADEAFYRPEKNTAGGINPHYDWHWDFNTGCGDLGNQGIHQMDVARWFLGKAQLAPRVFSVGGRVGYDDAGNTPNTQIVLHAYEKAPLVFEVRGLPQSSAYHTDRPTWESHMDAEHGVGIGNVIYCEKGYLTIPSSYDAATAYDRAGKVIKEFHGGGVHHQNWLEAIVANDRSHLNAEVHEGHLSSTLCHGGNVSYRLGKKTPIAELNDKLKDNELLSGRVKAMLTHLKANGVDAEKENLLTVGEWLTIDPATETFVGNDAATALRSRAVQRKPFEVPDIERETAGQSAAG